MPSGPDVDARRSRSERPSGERSGSKKADDPARKAGKVAKDASNVAQKVSKSVGSAVGGAADALGGVSVSFIAQCVKLILSVERVRQICEEAVSCDQPTLTQSAMPDQRLQPNFLRFRQQFIPQANRCNQQTVQIPGVSGRPRRPSIVSARISFPVLTHSLWLRSTMPLFAWPLDFAARLLSFVFLYNSGLEELKAGFGSRSETSAMKVKSQLTVLLLVSFCEQVPMFLFDTTYHFGALWTFLLPMCLFITPDRRNPKETVAVWIADSIFAQVSNVLDSIVPEAFVVSVMA